MHRCSHLSGVSSLPQLEEWPPVWKAVEESPQFKCGMLQMYMTEWETEKYDHLDDSAYPLTKRGVRVENTHNNLKRFLKQVRASRGYDVDVRPPGFARSPFYPKSLSFYMADGNEKAYTNLKAAVSFVIGIINSQAEAHNVMERFDFHEINKIVQAYALRTTLITFSVREVTQRPNAINIIQAMVYNPTYCEFELREWRFKPQEGEGEGEEATAH